MTQSLEEQLANLSRMAACSCPGCDSVMEDVMQVVAKTLQANRQAAERLGHPMSVSMLALMFGLQMAVSSLPDEERQLCYEQLPGLTLQTLQWHTAKMQKSAEQAEPPAAPVQAETKPPNSKLH